MNQLVPIERASNVEAYRASTDAASMCREIVVSTATNIQGRKYVCVEGWQAIAIAHGCTASARGVERIDGGVRAIGEVRRMSDGAVIAEAEGFVGEDEPTWFGGEITSYGKRKVLAKRADYAIRAMAQTRAISRACRSAFAHVVVMMNAGLSTTPAEEVPYGGFTEVDDRAVPAEKSPPRANDPLTNDQRDVIQTLAPAAGRTTQQICELYEIKSLKELTAGKAAKLIERLKGDAAARGEKHSDILDDDMMDRVPY